jgi:phospholipid/cholesterol/gamma-HCH transport system ATP-binding protein
MNCVRLAGDKVAVLIEGKCYAFGTYETLSKTTDVQLQRYFE